MLNARDPEALIAFYRQVIGLEPERLEEYRKGQVPFASLRIDPSTIIDVLGPEGWGGEREGAGNLDHFCLAVATGDWQPLLDRLEAAGVETEMGPARLSGARGEGTGIYIRDPEGNRVELRYY